MKGPHTEHMGCLSANLVLPPVSIGYLAIAQYQEYIRDKSVQLRTSRV